MLRLQPPVKSLETLVALAASGMRGIAPKAKAELTARKNEALRQEVKPS